MKQQKRIKDILTLKQNNSWEHNKTGNNWSPGVIKSERKKKKMENPNTKSSENIIKKFRDNLQIRQKKESEYCLVGYVSYKYWLTFSIDRHVWAKVHF